MPESIISNVDDDHQTSDENEEGSHRDEDSDAREQASIGSDDNNGSKGAVVIDYTDDECEEAFGLSSKSFRDMLNDNPFRSLVVEPVSDDPPTAKEQRQKAQREYRLKLNARQFWERNFSDNVQFKTVVETEGCKKIGRHHRNTAWIQKVRARLTSAPSEIRKRMRRLKGGAENDTADELSELEEVEAVEHGNNQSIDPLHASRWEQLGLDLCWIIGHKDRRRTHWSREHLLMLALLCARTYANEHGKFKETMHKFLMVVLYPAECDGRVKLDDVKPWRRLKRKAPEDDDDAVWRERLEDTIKGMQDTMRALQENVSMNELRIKTMEESMSTIRASMDLSTMSNGQPAVQQKEDCIGTTSSVAHPTHKSNGSNNNNDKQKKKRRKKTTTTSDKWTVSQQ